MGRLLVFAVTLIAIAFTQGGFAQETNSSLLKYGIEAVAIDTDGLPSWVDGSVGKFANGTEATIRGYVEHTKRLTDTLSSNVVLEVTGDQLGDPVNVTEAYLHWRPVPRSNTRYRIRLGAFYPRLSMENSLPGWRSPYTINYSAINTWLAEELRTSGIELTAIRSLPRLGPGHRLILQTSVFGWNDPAGSLLAWRGWAVHDRQTRFGDNLPLQPLPLNQPGEMFEAQAPVIEPFKEVDDRPGIYSSAEWNMRGKASVRALYYDNRADPEALENGQYAWHTRFWSFGLKLALPGKSTLITQWMAGNTGMGPLMSGNHVVDNNFASYFVLLSKKHNKHRFSVRFDRFRVDDIDVIDADNNQENGFSWTLNHQLQLSSRLNFSTEWTQTETSRPGWAYNGFSTDDSENQIQMRIRYSF